MAIEYCWSGDEYDRLPGLAADLVRRQVSVIVANGPAARAAKAATETIPIVFMTAGDPVGSGFVASLARPGGTVTGFESFPPDMGGKWLEVLKQSAPNITRVLALMHPETKANRDTLRLIREAAPRFGVEVTGGGVHDAIEIEAAVSSFATESNGGVIALPHAVTVAHHDLIVRLELKHKLAARRFVTRSGHRQDRNPAAQQSLPRCAILRSGAREGPGSEPALVEVRGVCATKYAIHIAGRALRDREANRSSITMSAQQPSPALAETERDRLLCVRLLGAFPTDLGCPAD